MFCFVNNPGFYFILLSFILLEQSFHFPGFYSNFLFHSNPFFYFFFFFLVYSFYRTCFCFKKSYPSYWDWLFLFFMPVLSFFLFVTSQSFRKPSHIYQKGFINDWQIKFTLFDGPGILHGFSFLLTSLFFFSIVSYFFFEKPQPTISTKIQTLTINSCLLLVLCLCVYTVTSGGYWAFFSEVWGNWFNNDPIEIFFLYFFFLVVVIFHISKNVIFFKTIIFFFFITFSFFLWSVRLGFFGSKHNSFTFSKPNLKLTDFFFEFVVYFRFFITVNHKKESKKAVYSKKVYIKPKVGVFTTSFWIMILNLTALGVLCVTSLQKTIKILLVSQLLFVYSVVFFWFFFKFFCSHSRALFLFLHIFTTFVTIYVFGFINIYYYNSLNSKIYNVNFLLDKLNESFYGRAATDCSTIKISFENHPQSNQRSPGTRLDFKKNLNNLTTLNINKNQPPRRGLTSYFAKNSPLKYSTVLDRCKQSIGYKQQGLQLIELDGVFCCSFVFFFLFFVLCIF